MEPDQVAAGEPDVVLQFNHELTAPRAARDAVAPLLREDGAFADAVSVVTSELVSNVVQHTDDGGCFKAWDDDPLVVTVDDDNSTVPARIAPNENGGRGLGIIDNLADEWGVKQTSTGKKVWAAFRRPKASEG